ncbi:type IX secretion system membrane protein PorP/SprF [Maribellus comscasis]|uniref:Type IX secretion system membrane protein PorP/SprF n=1 Tax=Maribellus comscasis TaxID=2681766 RepID=A0A6I6JMP5_9BACT|nr:type IX secretion system membrane protein PorP/SprF [Maribellus comscasis]QGY43691.1 type IX secretion system membrane protein PorP/SprF [Maribellus comscasis]
MGRRNSRKIITILIVILLTLKGFSQQDPILTQYMFNMQTINPAYAGMWEKIGFSSLVRKQWAGIEKSPLTEIISFHSPLKNEFVGVGLNVMNDRFGKENRLSIFADYSYEISLTPQTRLRFGLKFGFMNYKNPLTQYQLYPDNEYDEAFAEDVDLKFLPNFGFGAFLYDENYYINFSIPKLVENDFRTNINNYSTQAEVRTFYVGGGYVFRLRTLNNLIFKPTLLVRATWNNPLQFDIGANFMLMEKLWIGGMFRSGDAVCVTSQWIFNNNLRLGFGIDVTYTEIYPYQFGTYEFSIGYDIDFYGRSYVRAKYF